MQKLFENWRKYLTEATDPDSDADDAAELRDIANDLEPEAEDERSLQRRAEDDGWKDYRDDQDRVDHWETFEDGKYLEYWQLGYDNAQEQHEMDIYHDELSRGEYD